MKKITLLVNTVFCFSILSLGQISKGSLLIGGDLSGVYQNTKVAPGSEYINKGFLFSPMLGITTKQNLIQGGFIRVGFTDMQNNGSGGKSNANNLGVGYFIRKYSSINNNFYGFLQVNGGVSYSKNAYEYATSENSYKQTTIGIDISPGLSYKISKKLHLEAGLRQIAEISYQRNKNISINQNITETQTSNQISLASSLDNFSGNLFFGFRLLIDKK